MKVKRYIADNYQDALKLIKAEMGSDAVILQQSSYKERGLRGLFKKKKVEVVAAVEENKIDERDLFIKDLYEIKSLLREFKHSETKDESKKDLVYELVSRGVDDKLSKILAEGINEISDDNLETLQKRIVNFIGPPKKITGLNEKKRAVFIGPTGVGKTTTIAKIASNLILREKKKVLLITADIFRIAGAEQLKIYGEILGVPVMVVNNIFDLNRLEGEISKYDVVLIDTAGRSHTDSKKMQELKTFLQYGTYDEVYLCLSAATKNSDIKKIIKSYDFIDEYNLLFTKLDETDNYSVILNSIYYSKKSVSYVTNGQMVPDDISLADSKMIAQNILKGN
ncbi:MULTISPECIES: DEAD/DEAH box helicase family protein [Thermoanaerobacterium]|uniref:Flagellar biosynthesis protein FlhF n=2 Tax=Thermoanaerobacterium TaxID=28895 RepID=W9EC53_9THEO|nr:MULTISPECIES: DEAD/DEAH box helicase family protein [Thermoanaerobacterium]AFK86807.1 flagellar biosynthetic protein FlhF [Thermoanaerobacterium saccharolyticum JW/SL-YS485]ETO38575.1 flagellar biosynthetic protein FlhF [Thermoanaerobacterium aotearoense SCUT27]